jgi:hypothetical protein
MQCRPRMRGRGCCRLVDIRCTSIQRVKWLVIEGGVYDEIDERGWNERRQRREMRRRGKEKRVLSN